MILIPLSVYYQNFMKTKLLAFLLFGFYQSGFSQVTERIQGQVVFDKTVANKVEVINATSKNVALTDTEGKFTITVEAKDQLVFVAKNHEIKELKVTAAILKQGFISMTLVAKVEELKEVVVQNTPSIKLSKDAKWEQAKLDQYTLEKNASSLKNPGVYNGSIENGMDLMRIGGMLLKLFIKEKEVVKKSPPQIEFKQLARSSCDEKFYLQTLKLKPEEISLFLQFCDADPKSKTLQENSNILSMMDFLSIKNIEFKKL
ncbi:hypothetical protein IQ02_02205 [Flavobacterium glaciei]|uniref:Carboxypeptidase-like protein n=2 Tax=Flavobacterium glaciei TaxID=386300 RepID=A0A562PMN4_9FLAO|nr:hypothetical protein DFR66_11111 [Flavobacterium glaciei]TWI45731.1 hypothetical protein IQ02_02205 [Flavobacterium glaciei]